MSSIISITVYPFEWEQVASFQDFSWPPSKRPTPYLFIICMEKLSTTINNAVQAGSWDPIQISASRPHISHLLFANDVLLFTKANNSLLRFIIDMFSHFNLVSGLKINLSKSRAFYSSGTSITSIKSTTSFEKYLGFPILKGRAERNDFLFIIEKMQSILASWKHRMLNKSGRVTLASSVLSSISSYCMQVTWLPQSICDSIDQTTHNFIWKNANNKGIHLIGWNKIDQPKKLGGLGIRTTRETNICLESLCGIWFNPQRSYGLIFSLTGMSHVLKSSMLLLTLVILLFGQLSFVLEIFSKMVSLGVSDQVLPLFGHVLGVLLVS